MASELHPFPVRSVDVTVDEGIAAAERQLGEVSGFMNGNDLTIWIIIGVVFLLVIAALAMIYGRLSRERGDYDDEVADPFGQNDRGNDGYYHDDFSAIRITREHEPEEEPIYDDEPEPQAQPVIRDRFAHGGDPFRDRNEASENVVPLRAAEPVPEPPTPPVYEEIEEQVTVASAEGPGDYRYGGTSRNERPTYVREEPAMDRKTDRGGYDDDNQPFVAPFIREYIEDAERRQYQRLDDLREDMRRELTGIRDEQSNRLDLFLNSIDRKIGGVLNPRSEPEDSATRRRIDNLSTAVDRVSEALQRHDDRLSELNRSVDKQLADVAPLRAELRTVHEDVLSFRRDVEANTMTVRGLKDDFDILRENFGRMERSFLDKARSDGSVNMRLADVVRETLRPEEYELNVRLRNGASADCLIYLNHGQSKVAVDGGFPVESFEQLPSRDAVRRNLPQAKAAEDDFRRTVLRSIFSCADRCIVSGETADSAILFLPSEAAYTVLHDRFPDLVRDSHRARVWLTSPSTLMGTLNLLHNIFPGQDAPDADDFGSFEEHDPIEARQDEDDPFYAGPSEQSYRRREPAREEYRHEERNPERDRDRERAATIEKKLQALREEEESLAEELMRTRQRPERPEREERRASSKAADARPRERERRYRPDDSPPRRRDRSDDFETRFERFTFDLDESRDAFGPRDRRSFDDDEDDDLLR